jgi:hypothetical protein
MPWSHLNDPSHWRARAIEARTMADHITDPASRGLMLNVAAEYEELAKRAEERAKRSQLDRSAFTHLRPPTGS